MNLFKTLLVAAFAACTCLSSLAAAVFLDVNDSTQVGQSFSVQVRVDQPFAGLDLDEELLFFGFTLDFDTALLKLKGYSMAAGWDDDTAGLGAGNYGGSAFPGVANAGQASLVLATLNFEVLDAGLTSVDVSSDPANLNLGLGYLWAGSLPLEASAPLTLSAAAVPEPATMLLIVIGLVGMAAARRRQLR